MLKNPVRVNMTNEGLAVSFIWKDQDAQSLGYILITIVLNPLERQSFSWNTDFSLFVRWNNLLKDFLYLLLVTSCHPILTIGAIAFLTWDRSW